MSDLKAQVITAWANAKPLSDDAALTMALAILDQTPKARAQFRDWLNANIDYARTLYG